MEWKNFFEIFNSYSYLKPIGKAKRVCIFGFGGSGISGKIIEFLGYEYSSVPILTFNTLFLPAWLTKDDFLILVSYSGNTKETLEIFKKAKNFRKICITSNGKLEKMGKEVIKLPRGLLPRESLPYQLAILFNLLRNFMDLDFKKEIQRFLRVIKRIRVKRFEIKEPLIVYCWYSYFPSALRLKQQLNENSKISCYLQCLPEACHNEIEAPSKSTKILLRGNKENEKMVKSFLKTLDEKVIEIKIKSTYFAEMLGFIYFADKLSLKIAEEKGIEWRKTPRIKKYKSLIE